ncbi:MAG TPA: DUF5990 family protein [Acidimicrobiales bacterium]|nr:DUF5990 family protein [Acidimicrobiales bacterium]
MGMLNVRIVGERLPGRTFEDCANVHIGVQRGDEVVQVQPADATSVRFSFGIVLRELEDGGIDFRSPFVHGKPGDRFFYLSWGDVADGGAFAMFRRAKLMLAAVPSGLITATTGSLEGYVSLTDPNGGPVCAAVRPPVINWSTSG